MKDNIYIVKKNDNLYDIAKKHNTTVGILKAMNNLTSNMLQIGQVLKIPTSNTEQALPSDYLIYTVKPGDNLYNIAKNYGVSLEELINFNEQGTTLLNIGEQILIPIKDKEFNNANLNNNVTYVVKPGDTLYSIAKRYNTTADTLMDFNNLSSNLLKIGDILFIPNSNNYKTYVVRTNETLESIADKFNVNLYDIMLINGLETDDLTVGQIIIIPN